MNIPYSAGWKASINGRQTEVLRADYGFMACVLEEGENEVYFKYTTPGIKIGAFISVFSTVLVMIFLYKKQEDKD